MSWKQQLRILEQMGDFDVAIFFMKKVIEKHPNDVDAYIFMLFRLMDTIVEHACYFANVSKTVVSDIKKEYYDTKETYYEVLAKKYFQDGYNKFSENAEFLFCVGTTAVMSEWYFGIDVNVYNAMLAKAQILDPDNPLYKHAHYWSLFEKDHNNQEAIEYARMVLQENSPIKGILDTKGAFGVYMSGILLHKSRHILELKP
jgi:tetratricopeptide (TPR) repeat protein